MVLPIEVVCEDGTPLTEAPKNPLVEQWKNEGYTKNNFGNECNDILGYYEDGRPIMNYSCVLCTSPNCFKSEGWKIPEKDKVTYDKWIKEMDVFYILHNPTLYQNKKGK